MTQPRTGFAGRVRLMAMQEKSPKRASATDRGVNATMPGSNAPPSHPVGGQAEATPQPVAPPDAPAAPQPSTDAAAHELLPTLPEMIERSRALIEERGELVVIYFHFVRYSKIEELYGWEKLDAVLETTAAAIKEYLGIFANRIGLSAQ